MVRTSCTLKCIAVHSPTVLVVRTSCTLKHITVYSPTVLVVRTSCTLRYITVHSPTVLVVRTSCTLKYITVHSPTTLQELLVTYLCKVPVKIICFVVRTHNVPYVPSRYELRNDAIAYIPHSIARVCGRPSLP